MTGHTTDDTAGSSHGQQADGPADEGQKTATRCTDGGANATPARFVYFDFALIGLFDDSLGDDIVTIQCSGAFDLLHDLVGRVLALKGEGEDIVYS